MKSISASIIVFAGVACLYTANGFPRTGGGFEFVMIIGIVIIGLGMIGWYRTPGNPPG
jgi:hypothetical protein